MSDTAENGAGLADMPLPQRDRLVAEVWAFLVERGYTITAPGGPSGGLTGRICTDPDCTIPRKPGFPMHGPHDFRARSTRTMPPGGTHDE
jgi:hypothetical protein